MTRRLAGCARHHLSSRLALCLLLQSSLTTASERRGHNLKGCKDFLPASQGQNLALTVFCVPYSLDSGIDTAHPPESGIGCLISTIFAEGVPCNYRSRANLAHIRQSRPDRVNQTHTPQPNAHTAGRQCSARGSGPRTSCTAPTSSRSCSFTHTISLPLSLSPSLPLSLSPSLSLFLPPSLPLSPSLPISPSPALPHVQGYLAHKEPRAALGPLWGYGRSLPHACEWLSCWHARLCVGCEPRHVARD